MAVMLRKEPSLWQSWITDRDQDIFLSVDVRRVIGILYSVRSPSLQLVAEAIKLPVDHVLCLARQLKASTNVVVQEALANGLSVNAAVALPHNGRKIKCKICRQFLATVPCQQCLIARRQHELTKEQVEEMADRPEPPQPTHAKPGSYEKMMVMQKRFLAGYSIFHHEDIEVAINPIPHNMRSTKLRREQFLNGHTIRRPNPNSSGTLRSVLSRYGDPARGAPV